MTDYRHRCIFFHQRKVAGTSIIKAFGWTPKDPEWHRFNNGVLSPEWQSRSPQERSFFVFSAVRNPFDRLVSAWKYLAAYRDRPLLDVLKNPPRLGHDYRHLTRPQVDILRDPQTNRLVADAVMRFETLQADFNAVCQRVGLPPTLLGRHNSSPRQRHYREYFDDETRELATELFKEDLAAFAYEF